MVWSLGPRGTAPASGFPLRVSAAVGKVYEMAFAADAAGHAQLLAGGTGALDGPLGMCSVPTR